jgi:hypothetical protein
MFKKILFIVSLFLLQNCNENSTNYIIEEEFYKIEGKVYLEDNGVIVTFAGVKVKLNSDSSFTNSEGVFLFDGLKAGNYQIKIEYAGYYTKTDSIKITDKDQYIIYHLTKINSEINYKIEGKVYLEDNGVIVTFAGVKVKLNSDSSFTNSEGAFLFDGLKAGNYQIKIEYAGYYTKTDSIKITDKDLYFEYHLTKIIDYLPLYVGKTWRYKRYGDSFSHTYSKDHYGTSYWEIISEEKSYGIIKYNIREILNDTIYLIEYDNGYFKRDTIWTEIDTTNFSFREYDDKTVEISISQFLTKVKRYDVRKDSVEYINLLFPGTGHAILKPEKGITYLTFGASSPGGLYWNEVYSQILE